MSKTREERNNPLPIPEFRAGDFLVLRTHDWGSDRMIVKVLAQPAKSGERQAKVVWRMGVRAEAFDYPVAHVDETCDWTIEVVGRGDNG